MSVSSVPSRTAVCVGIVTGLGLLSSPAFAVPAPTPTAMSPQASPSPQRSVGATTSATPMPTKSVARERLRAHMVPPPTATAPAVLQVHGPAGRAIGGVVFDTTTGAWVGEVSGRTGSGGVGTLRFAAPAGGWRSGHTYYFQAFTPDGSTNAVRGNFKVQAGTPDPTPVKTPTASPAPPDEVRPVVSVRTPTCSGEAVAVQVTGAKPGALVEIALMADGTSIHTSLITKQMQQGGDLLTRVDTYLPEGGFTPGAKYRLFVTSPAGDWSGDFVAPTATCSAEGAARPVGKDRVPAAQSERRGLASTGH